VGSRDGVVVVTRQWAGSGDPVPGRVKDLFLLQTIQIIILGPTEDCIQLLVGILSLEVKWSGCEANHLHLSSTMVKSEAPSLPPPCCISVVHVQGHLYLYVHSKCTWFECVLL